MEKNSGKKSCDSGSCEFEIPVPDGFTLPENAKPGEAFSIVCDLEVSPDGKMLTVTKIGDVETKSEGAEPKEEASYKPDYSDYSQGIMSEGSQAPAQAEA